MTLTEQLNEIVDVLYKTAFTGWAIVFILMVPTASNMSPSRFALYFSAEYLLGFWIILDTRREKRMQK